MESERRDAQRSEEKVEGGGGGKDEGEEGKGER